MWHCVVEVEDRGGDKTWGKKLSGVKPRRRCLPTDSHSRLFGGLLAAQQEPAQDMERVVLIPCVEPLRHTCLPASEDHSVQTGIWLSFTPFLSSL